jgi:hypothetical protein
VHFALTAHPTAEWTVQQMREAFPLDTPPRYLLRDRDRIFGKEFVDQLKAMCSKQTLSAPRSPWQRAYVERVIGTIRRECLDHLIIFDERSLQRHLRSFISYYHPSRTHLALAKDCRFRKLEEGREEAGPDSIFFPKQVTSHGKLEQFESAIRPECRQMSRAHTSGELITKRDSTGDAIAFGPVPVV